MNWTGKQKRGGVVTRRSPSVPPMPVERIEVCIATENRVAAEALAARLGRESDIHVFGAVGHNPAAFADAPASVVLLDGKVSEGVSVATELGHSHPEAHIVVTNISSSNEVVEDFVKVGVTGFVLEDATFDEFVRTIHEVASGKSVLPPALANPLFSRVRAYDHVSRDDGAVDRVQFTRREREVIERISAGMSNREIAKRLNIGVYTVRTHVRNVLAKLALHSRLQIAAYASEHPFG